MTARPLPARLKRHPILQSRSPTGSGFFHPGTGTGTDTCRSRQSLVFDVRRGSTEWKVEGGGPACDGETERRGSEVEP